MHRYGSKAVYDMVTDSLEVVEYQVVNVLISLKQVLNCYNEPVTRYN